MFQAYQNIYLPVKKYANARSCFSQSETTATSEFPMTYAVYIHSGHNGV